jgi:hypothetical protein
MSGFAVTCHPLSPRPVTRYRRRAAMARPWIRNLLSRLGIWGALPAGPEPVTPGHHVTGAVRSDVRLRPSTAVIGGFPGDHHVMGM